MFCLFCFVLIKILAEHDEIIMDRKRRKKERMKERKKERNKQPTKQTKKQRNKDKNYTQMKKRIVGKTLQKTS